MENCCEIFLIIVLPEKFIYLLTKLLYLLIHLFFHEILTDKVIVKFFLFLLPLFHICLLKNEPCSNRFCGGHILGRLKFIVWSPKSLDLGVKKNTNERKLTPKSKDLGLQSRNLCSLTDLVIKILARLQIKIIRRRTIVR